MSARIGWSHWTVNLGTYSSTTPTAEALRQVPTLAQLRHDDYQGVYALLGYDGGKAAIPRAPKEALNVGTALNYIDIPGRSANPMLNSDRVAQLMECHRRLGHKDYVAVPDDAPVTIGVDVVGQVNSLLLLPGCLLTSCVVRHRGELVFSMSIKQPDSYIQLPLALLVFDGDRLEHLEVNDYWRPGSIKDRLSVFSTIPVEYYK